MTLEPSTPIPFGAHMDLQSSAEDDWVVLIAPGGVGMLNTLQLDRGAREVKIRNYRYTPRGLLYDLEPEAPELTVWQVAVREVRPIYGRSPLIRVNLVTGETQPVQQ
ncbi:MAG TPA: hypothetical protein VNP04_06775 [Alphaproteobacteria bacterium]|nr:hypothetical protein [Alphaproteobacteria bacterium]